MNSQTVTMKCIKLQVVQPRQTKAIASISETLHPATVRLLKPKNTTRNQTGVLIVLPRVTRVRCPKLKWH